MRIRIFIQDNTLYRVSFSSAVKKLYILKINKIKRTDVKWAGQNVKLRFQRRHRRLRRF